MTDERLRMEGEGNFKSCEPAATSKLASAIWLIFERRELIVRVASHLTSDFYVRTPTGALSYCKSDKDGRRKGTIRFRGAIRG